MTWSLYVSLPQENTKNIAVDLVLLPEDSHLRHIIAINNSINQPIDQQILLAEDGALPHVSLFMGSMTMSLLPQINKVMSTIADSYPVLDLTIDKISYNNGGVSSLNIAPNDRLQDLHEHVARSCAGILEAKADVSSIYGTQSGLPGTIDWINNYLNRNSFENFWPHITLGYGRISKDQLKINPIKVDRLGLFHLGNHCTCAKAIALFPLNGN